MVGAAGVLITPLVIWKVPRGTWCLSHKDLSGNSSSAASSLSSKNTQLFLYCNLLPTGQKKIPLLGNKM